MMARKPTWIWQQPAWPALTFDPDVVTPALRDARRAQAAIEAKAHAIGLIRIGEMTRDSFADEVLATAAIEGERLDPASVRSSVLRRLGLAQAGQRDRQVDGLVEVIDDATAAAAQPLTDDRLHRWQAALFPGGASGIRRIAVGRYRDHADPMQIVSGRPGREVIHYEAPPSHQVPDEMTRFLAWFAQTAPGQPAAIDGLDCLVRAALAHLWFETIHPFEDGNGRIGRAIVDMAVAQDQRTPARLISLSRQWLESRSGYYDALNEAQRGNCDVTAWVTWFARQYTAACERTGEVIDRALEKSRFWADHAEVPVNARQRKVLQRLLDAGDGGFTGGLNAEKYMKMTGASKATATRDLSGLRVAGLLRTTGVGKALRYHVAVPGWTHDPAEPDRP